MLINFSYSKLFLVFYILFTFVLDLVISRDVLRGIPFELQSRYDPSKAFICFDGTAQIPFSFINDDYCDCRDGSDEPGTSACSNGVFYCENKGHISLNIPSSRVNDGICDCCDGTDEYFGRVDCTNSCLAMGQQAREAAQEQIRLLSDGHRLYQGLVEQGRNILNEYKQKLEILKEEEKTVKQIHQEKDAVKSEKEAKEKEALSKYDAEKEELKKQKEEQEMLENMRMEKENAKLAFAELDKNADGILTASELQQFLQFDTNRDGVVSLEEAKFYLHAKEEMDEEEFVITGWMIMKPIYLLNQEEVAPPSEPEFEREEETTDEPTEGDLPDEDEDDEATPDYPEKAEDDQKDEEVAKYDPEVQALVDDASQARREFNEASERLRKSESEIQEIEATLNADFGPNSEFLSLKGQCFEFEDREYIYRLCPFDQATQNPKSGGASINLGKWGRWTGPAELPYTSMRYESGTVCWNGPSRSANINLSCGLENKLLAVSEPNRCEYQMDFYSPAMCSTPPSTNFHQHAEL